MRVLFTIIFTLTTFVLRAQKDTVSAIPAERHAAYAPHCIMPTVAIGFIDGYRNNYSLPPGFEKNNTSGFAPVLVKLEYGLSKSISLAATFGYDVFQYNFSQEYQGNNGSFTRYRTDAFKLYSGGITAFYHLGRYIHVNHLDPFAGVGLSIDNIRYSAYPAGDSTAPKPDHIASIYIKVGARYYFSDKFSLYGDAGYDKTSIISIGASCRFFKRKKH